MGRKPYCPPPVEPPACEPEPPVQPPVDCGCEPEPPPPPVVCEPCGPNEPSPGGSGGLLGLLPNISITGEAGLLGPQLGLGAILPVDISLIGNESSSGGLNIDLSPVDLTTPEDGLGGLINVGDILGGVGGGSGEGGLPLISLDSETDAAINVPVFGEDGVLGGATGVGGVIGGGEDGLPLFSLDSETDAVINVPVLGENGAIGGALDIGGVVGGGGDGGLPLISLNGETDAAIDVPVLGQDGLLGGATGGGGFLNIGGLLGGGGGAADVGSLLNAAMSGVGNTGSLGAIMGGDAYDGNVPLAGNLNSALGSTLDLLTTTTSLFDVPALDILGGDGLDG